MHRFVHQEFRMPITTKDIVPFGPVRARLTELADEVAAGGEEVITRNGEGYVALIGAARLDHYHRLERAPIYLTLLDEAERGLDDVDAGRYQSAAEARSRYGKKIRK